MNSNDDINQDYQAIRDALKKLPRVKTSDDFDRQLQLKLTAQKNESGPSGIFVTKMRMPALAYSVAALFLICGVSFYILYRTHSLEFRESQQIPLNNPGQPIENKSSGSTTKNIEPGTATQQGTQSSKSPDAPAELPVQQGDAKADKHSGTTDKNIQMQEERLQNGGQQEEPINQQKLLKARNAQSRVSSAGQPVPMTSETKSNRHQSVQPEGIRSESQSINPPSLQMDSLQMGTPSAPAIRSMVAPMPVSKSKFNIQPVNDSIRKKSDRLKLDSLKRIRQMRDSIKSSHGIKPF